MLFDVTFNPFKVVLTQSIYSTDDYLTVKLHTKRVLLEILDTYGSESLNLTWSGGADSAFIGLCYNELVEEGTLPSSTFSFYTARYILDGKPCSLEFERGMSFYKKYINSDIDLHIHDIDLSNNKTFLKKSCLLINEIRRPTLGSLVQEQFRRDMGGYYIVGVNYPYRYDTTGLFTGAAIDQFWHHLPNSPCISIFDWDADIWSSFITPFFINRPVIPYRKTLHYNKYLWSGMKGKTVQYMICFPQLFELMFKHMTVPYIGSFALVQQFLYKKYKHYNYRTSIELPDGQKIISLEQIQEYFNV